MHSTTLAPEPEHVNAVRDSVCLKNSKTVVLCNIM